MGFHILQNQQGVGQFRDGEGPELFAVRFVRSVADEGPRHDVASVFVPARLRRVETAGRLVEKTVVRAAFMPSHVDERDDPLRRREPHFAGVVLGARELCDPLSFLQTLRNRARTIGSTATCPCGTTCEHEQKPDPADRLRKCLAVRTKTRMLHSGCHICDIPIAFVRHLRWFFACGDAEARRSFGFRQSFPGHFSGDPGFLYGTAFRRSYRLFHLRNKPSTASVAAPPNA